MFNKMKNWFNKVIVKPYKATVLCLRYPFLYTRNRFTDKHYNNWFIINKNRKLYEKYHKFHAESDNISIGKRYYIVYIPNFLNDNIRRVYYWTNWWALPLTKVLNFIHLILELFHCIPTYTELDTFKYGCPGWYKKFGKELLKDLKKQLKKDGLLYKFRITQWKEKYGRMELYCNYGTEEVYNIIEKYSSISEETCFYCGVPAEYITSPYGWTLPYCKDCYEKHGRGAKIDFVKRNGEWEDISENSKF